MTSLEGTVLRVDDPIFAELMTGEEGRVSCELVVASAGPLGMKIRAVH